MARNSIDNSLAKLIEIKEITKVYQIKKDNSIFRRKRINFTQRNKINRIEKACCLLSEPYRTIIKNTFLENKDLYWWQSIYPKTTYYRLRKKAINTFLLAYELL